jgi:hypothetical protein
MKHRVVIVVVLCLALVVLLALAAPLAAAKAEFAEASGTETYADGFPAPTTPEPWYTGNVGHWTFENQLIITSDSPYLAGTNYTHLVVVFDRTTWAGTCHGTYRIELRGDNGAWEGTFHGTINLYTGEWDVYNTGIGVSGAVAGMISRGHDLNGEITGSVTAPHGF